MIGEVSNFYEGGSFVHVVNVVNCTNSKFQVGVVSIQNGESKLSLPIFNTIYETNEYWESDHLESLIAINPTVVCDDGKM